MAISPYFSTTNQYIKYDIHVDETSVNEAENSSTVHVYVIVWRTNTGYTTDGAGTCYVNIDGSSYSNSWSYGEKPISYQSNNILFNKTVTIPHNPDGSKRIYVSASISHDRFSSATNGFYVDLTQINTAPDAPTIFNITANNGDYVGLGDTITCSWSGDSGNITGYESQFRYDNGSWSESTVRSGSSFTDILSDTSYRSGKTIQYRIRALNGQYASDWKESNALTISGAMDIRTNNAWNTGSVWINVNGVWKRAKRVWIKQNGQWVISK